MSASHMPTQAEKGQTFRALHERAVERVRAAAEVTRALPFAFTLTGRAENYLHGRPDLKDTIKRLQAFQEAGADVLYAPGLVSKDDIAAVVSSVDRPVNVVMGMQGVQLSLAALSAIWGRRGARGSALSPPPPAPFLPTPPWLPRATPLS